MTYNVQITECLQKIIAVAADNEQEAINKIKDRYNSCEIVLGADDFIEREVNIVNDD